jgi:hypothetical protein
MSVNTTPARRDGDEQPLLADPSYEPMSFDSMADQLGHLPDWATVAITILPQLGPEATVEWAERAADKGYERIPHVAARYVTDPSELESIVGRLAAAGVTDISFRVATARSRRGNSSPRANSSSRRMSVTTHSMRSVSRVSRRDMRASTRRWPK